MSATTHVREWAAKKTLINPRNVSADVSARVSGLPDGDGDPIPEPGSLTMCRPAFDALDRDWAALVRSPAGPAALRRWSDTPDLVAPDLDALVARVWAASKPDANRMCAAIAERAPADPTAARVLLQILRPGLRTLGRRLALGGSFHDVDVELLALAWERIRTYRVDRRPTSVTGNILMDVRKNYVQTVTGADAMAVSLQDLSPGRSPAAPSAEQEALDGHIPSLRRAHARLLASVDGGTITPTSATVVWRTRILEEDEADVAAELGVRVRTLQRRRQRTERELAKAS